MNKPCIQCGKECEIFPVQLGDIFTLVYLRICSHECMFLEAYDYIYKNGYHEDFGNELYDHQSIEDASERKKYIDEEILEVSIARMKGFISDPNLLNTPMPHGIANLFAQPSRDSFCSTTTMVFLRPTKDQKLEWARDLIDRIKNDLNDAIEDLEKIQNEQE